ncbi:MAG: hypothetical protein IT160_19105 [Bryobacterales bacterium]|nr:hypothetical protein [Bryobacterales bacterium]
MCPKATNLPVVLLAVNLLLVPAAAQTAGVRPDWRHIGNSAVEMQLAGLVTGPAERIWFSADGSSLSVLCRNQSEFSTADLEKWEVSRLPAPPAWPVPAADSLPEPGAIVRAASTARLYAAGKSVWRSEDGGKNWRNLTAYHGRSLVGDGLRDLAVSPVNPEEIALATDLGVWHSVDGGISWSSLNDNLPNLGIRRFLALPAGSNGLRVLADAVGEIEWAPGEKRAWRQQHSGAASADSVIRQSLSNALGTTITAYGLLDNYLYAGSSDGRLWSSADGGRSWLGEPLAGGSPVESIFVDPKEPRLALAALAGGGGSPRVLRTENGGLFWDDLTANLPDGSAHGITAERTSGAVYVATDTGLWMTYTDLAAPGPATRWVPISTGLPPAAARDVRLDSGGNQLFVAVDGFGVFTALAPHRLRDVRVVSSADFSLRAAAPGSLLTVLGARVTTARSGDRSLPVLDARAVESQLQVPFDAAGSSLALSLGSTAGSLWVGIPLRPVSPAIFVASADGAPMVMDSESGLLLDAANPARAGSRIQILATGLGRVRPDWPAGLAAPLENAPKVIAPVRATLNGAPLTVTRAILAPGYVGFYLVEAQLPDLVNGGPAELMIEAGGQQSNPVRIYVRQ